MYILYDFLKDAAYTKNISYLHFRLILDCSFFRNCYTSEILKMSFLSEEMKAQLMKVNNELINTLGGKPVRKVAALT